MLKLISDLDKKKKFLTDLAILPGFNFSNIDEIIKPLTFNEEIIMNNLIQKDKSTIDNKLFIKFYGVIDHSKKPQTKKNNTKLKKLKKNTRKK